MRGRSRIVWMPVIYKHAAMNLLNAPVKVFPFPKGDRTSLRIISNFKISNRHIKRPNWPTESLGQHLRHIDLRAKYFVSIDLTSGFYQIPIDEESQNLLVISAPMGRYKFTLLAQGIRSSSDIFSGMKSLTSGLTFQHYTIELKRLI